MDINGVSCTYDVFKEIPDKKQTILWSTTMLRKLITLVMNHVLLRFSSVLCCAIRTAALYYDKLLTVV